MRRLIPFLLVALGLPLFGSEGEQSFISYHDGQTILRQGYDGRDVEARLNLPVFSGDELITGRRGRTEVRLADGNVVAVDESTVIRFISLANSYDSGEDRSVIELQEGVAIVHLLESTDHSLRLDTQAASYVALTDGIYSVETDRSGRDQITILSGSVEIRTPERAYRLRAGESARVGVEGLYDIQGASGRETSFERWYLRRAERYTGGSSRYLDSRYSWVENDLNDHGDWVYIGEFGWVWRPYVTAGWRPYYNGRWHYGPSGSLIWASYEPWGWYPYHYGRWTHYSRHGWVWVPGYTYSPAWVYWTYGPSYIGWAPVGWYSCFQPYRPWFWDARTTFSVGVGFYGRIQLANADLSGWTFLDSGEIVSRRVDRAALTVDAVRTRIARGGGSAVFSSGSVRLTRDDIKDPATAIGRIARGAVGGGTGTERSGSLADLTPFFRRDPELSPEVRSQIDRSNLSESVRRLVSPTPVERVQRPTVSTPAGTGRDIDSVRRGVVNRPMPVTEPDRTDSPRVTVPDRAGRVERPVSRETTPARGSAPRVIGRSPDTTPAPVPRSSTPEATPTPRARPSAPEATTPAPNRNDDLSWRGRQVRPQPERPPQPDPERSWATRTNRPDPERSWATGTDRPDPERSWTRSDRPAPEREWRRSPTYENETGNDTSSNRGRDTSTAPIPRRVIDSIGGARMVPDADSRSRSGSSSRGRVVTPRPPTGSSSATRPSPSPRSSTAKPPSRSSSSSRSSSTRSSTPRTRPSPPSRSSSRGSSESADPPRSGGARRN